MLEELSSPIDNPSTRESSHQQEMQDMSLLFVGSGGPYALLPNLVR